MVKLKTVPATTVDFGGQRGDFEQFFNISVLSLGTKNFTMR